jgi:uncharacterized phage protein (TIGR01671 family)
MTQQRQIKFRGKDYRGEWVYGDLITKPVHHACVILENGVINHPVDPTSVGQYTGLHDRAGNEVYEGDVVVVSTARFNSKNYIGTNSKEKSFSGVVEWSTACFVVRLNNQKHIDSLGGRSRINLSAQDTIETFGNIYEHPNLIP